MRTVFFTFCFLAFSFASLAEESTIVSLKEVHTIVDTMKQCQRSGIDTSLEQGILLQEILQVHDHSIVSWNANSVIQFYEKMSEKDWESLKRNCREFSFDIFILSATQKKSLFPLLTAKGFPLGESFEIRFNDVHKKIIYDLSYRLIKENNCAFPKRSTKIDYGPYRWLSEISRHPDFIRLPMKMIHLCRDQVDSKIKRYLAFISNPTCNGLSYWLNGNLEHSFKGDWIKKDLFCDAYRSYQYLDLLSKNPSYHLDAEVWDTISQTDLFDGKNPIFKCKLYYPHPKREACYPRMQ